MDNEHGFNQRPAGSSAESEDVEQNESVMERREDPPVAVIHGGVNGSSTRAPVDSTAAGQGAGGFPNEDQEQIRQEGMNLWSLAIGLESHVESGVAGGLYEIERKEILGAARLKALSELQCVLRSTGVGIDWEDPISVPAGDLLLIVQMAMQRLG